jgi:hypothetical protein
VAADRVAKLRSFPRKRESRAEGWVPAFAGTNGAIPRLMAKGGADFTLCKRKRLCYSRTLARVVPGSSAVEQPAVNRLVAGSNPARGAIPLRAMETEQVP